MYKLDSNAIKHAQPCTRHRNLTVLRCCPPHTGSTLQSSGTGNTFAALGCAIPIDDYKSCPLAAWDYEDYISVDAGADVTCALLEDGFAECCEYHSGLCM